VAGVSHALRADGVTKAYGPEGVVEGASLAVEDGEVLLLMGPNGVGKTVLLSCLAGATTPESGDIEVFGRPVAETRGTHTSFLRQNAMGVDTLSGREVVALYRDLHPAFTGRWREYVADLGIEDALDKRFEHYSGGMKRKLEFAIALSIDVPVYLLDEPIAGVDLSMVGTFHNAILDQHDDGKTVVITSHRPADAALADRIAFMLDGRVTTVGTPDALKEAVPPVVRITGASTATEPERHVVGGTLFHHGAELRGFLDPDATLATLRETVARVAPDASVETVAPSYTDVFNYHVHVA
jgi:ABC-2 type transport system ATP-binding protein